MIRDPDPEPTDPLDLWPVIDPRERAEGLDIEAEDEAENLAGVEAA